MYESPIEKIYGELQTQMVQEDEKMSSEIAMENARECEENAAEYRQIVAWLTALQKIDIIIDEDVGNMPDYEVLERITDILRDGIPH